MDREARIAAVDEYYAKVSILRKSRALWFWAV